MPLKLILEVSKKNMEICNLKLMIKSMNFFPVWIAKTDSLPLIFINYTNIIIYFISKNNLIQPCRNFLDFDHFL